MASTADPPSPDLGMATRSVVIDNEASDDTTVVRVVDSFYIPGRFRLLKVISDLNFVIRTRSSVSVDGDDQFVDVFHVTDEEGNKVLDEATISCIQKGMELNSFEIHSAKCIIMAEEKQHQRLTVANGVDQSFQGTEDKFVFENKFSVSSSPKGGIDIKFGSSSLVHLPKQCSVRHPVVQMMLLAEDTFAHPRPVVAKAILHIMKKLSSISCATEAPYVSQAGWVTLKQHTAKSCNGEAYALATAPLRTPGHGYWIPVLWLDSGAAHHVVGDARILTNLRYPPAGSAETIVVADGSELPVVMVGDIWTEHFQIEDVYLVPGLEMNLVSVRQLARRQIFSTFCENHADLKRGHEQVGGAIADDGTSLYRLHFLMAI
ncbi:unnamed protein product [Urochloa humidicola]